MTGQALVVDGGGYCKIEYRVIRVACSVMLDEVAIEERSVVENVNRGK
jgi:hypothetical protein